MADLTLKNCVKAKDFIQNLSDEKQRTYFEFYLNQNSILLIAWNIFQKQISNFSY